MIPPLIYVKPDSNSYWWMNSKDADPNDAVCLFVTIKGGDTHMKGEGYHVVWENMAPLTRHSMQFIKATNPFEALQPVAKIETNIPSIGEITLSELVDALKNDDKEHKFSMRHRGIHPVAWTARNRGWDTAVLKGEDTCQASMRGHPGHVLIQVDDFLMQVCNQIDIFIMGKYQPKFVRMENLGGQTIPAFSAELTKVELLPILEACHEAGSLMPIEGFIEKLPAR